MREHLLIAGGGQAATQVAQSARQEGFEGLITLVTDERRLPYQRPPLSKAYLAGEFDPERLTLKPEEFYRTREIDLKLDTRVDAFDPVRSVATLSDGAELAFSHFVIATGSEPRRLAIAGAELEGIHYLRTIDDVEQIRQGFEPGRRLVIVGAGYIGLEVAACAARAGLEVTVLEAASGAMSRTVCADVGDFFVDRHRQAGVDFQFGKIVSAFAGETRINFVVTDDGQRFGCDLVLVAIGIQPRTDLAAAAGLAIENGIAVDQYGRTAAPQVYSAGDCTSHPHPWAGERIRLESVQNAIEQGKSVAASVCGASKAFDAVPWFWSDQYDLKLQIAGLSAGYDQTVIRGAPDSGSFSVFYLQNDRVIGADCVNDPRSFIAARNRLPQKPVWPVSAIADPNCDLMTL
jgi:3-phenylpropionate/trans-cinnamate dioxygenase ferredoxin reductase subunit